VVLPIKIRQNQDLCAECRVERTFGWLNRSRRLSKDFEALPETTETWIRIAMIQLMVRRLAAKA
jgi:putative transposase